VSVLLSETDSLVIYQNWRENCKGGTYSIFESDKLQ
jgi:hypothetical protein